MTTEILEDVVSDPTTEWNPSPYGTNGTLTTTTKVSTTANTPSCGRFLKQHSNTKINDPKTRTEETGTKNPSVGYC